MNANLASLSASLLVASGLCGGSAFAQQSEEELEVIEVEAPRVVRQEVGRTPTGGTEELISLTRRVSYADLDLAMHADVMELQKRINDTAEEACTQLADMFPLSDTDTPTCVREAVAGAMEEAQEAIAEAGGRAAARSR